VLSSGEDIKITVGGKPFLDHRVTLSLDGQENFELKSADEIIMRKYPRNFEMLVPENFSYFDVLRKKLSWGER
jgi:NAD kinase